MRLLSVNASSISISSPFSFVAFLITKIAKMDAMMYHIFELMDVSRCACPEWQCWPWNPPNVGQRIPCGCHCQANRRLVLMSSQTNLTFDHSHKNHHCSSSHTPVGITIHDPHPQRSELRKTSQMTCLRRGKRRMGEIACMVVMVVEREKEWSAYNYLRRDNIIYKASWDKTAKDEVDWKFRQSIGKA